MPNYKLIYFDGRGRAEAMRIMFMMAGQKFEDVRMTREEWVTFKPKSPFGQLPVLEVDGTPYAQSAALTNYVARELGFHGKTNLESLAIDQSLCLVEDFVQCVVKVMFNPDETNKAELMKNFQEQDMPKFLGFFEKMLKDNGTGYFVGNRMTVADIGIWEFMYGLEQRMKGALDKYPQLQALGEKVYSHEKIKDYIANRKPTEF